MPKKWLILPLVLIASALACAQSAPMVTPDSPPFPRTPIPVEDRPDGTPTANPFVEPPYDACHDQRNFPPGFTLFADGLCENEQCVGLGLESEVYAAWRAEMMRVFELDETGFAERIQLVDVSMMQSGSRVMVVIDYVVVNGWARTYQTDIVGFTEEPDEAMIVEKARQVIFEDTQISLPQVASIDAIEAQFKTCDSELEINWCYLDYPNFGGRLYVTAFKIIDQDADECLDAAVYVDTGELWYCRERPCMIDE